ncbi:MAG TPA: GNAT family N-acetyltransferase [Devosia sp.]|nr:GNAT family N-acetyltransferase [Devosia sp.]
MKLWMAPKGLHVEMAQPRHVRPMAKLHGRSFFHGWSESDFSDYLLKPHINPIYVACDAKQKLAGFMVLGLAKEEAELLSINVDAKWRNNGVAGAILQAGMQDLVTLGITALFLEVDESNDAAIALYRRFGFAEVGRREGYYLLKNGTRATALVMRANLN